MKPKIYKIFTKRIANELCKKGCRMVGTEIHNEKPWLYVYLFEDTPEFRAALQEASKRGDRND